MARAKRPTDAGDSVPQRDESPEPEIAKALGDLGHRAASFGLCEGTREELERTGKATDPFTGRALTRDDL